MPKHPRLSGITLFLLSASLGASTTASLASETQHGSIQKQAVDSKTELNSTQTGQSGILDASVKQDSLTGTANVNAIDAANSGKPLQGVVQKQSIGGSADLNADLNALSGATSGKALQSGAQKQGLEGSANLNALDATKSGRVLQGAVKKQALDGATELNALHGASSTKLLQGGVKDDAALQSSLKVIPINNQKIPSLIKLSPNFYPGVTQVSGTTVHYPPGQDPNSLSAGLGRAAHIIPPISTYTSTPRNGVVNWAPGYAAISTFSNINVGSPAHEMQAVNSHKGITSYVPGYEVTNITNKSFPAKELSSIVTHAMGPLGLGSGVGDGLSTVSVKGVTAYVPGYEVTNITKLRGPGQMTPISTVSGVSAYSPGYQVSICTARTGVITWDAGYEVTSLAPGLTKSTLGGVWYSPINHAPPMALRANEGSLSMNNLFGRPLPSEELKATGLLLPQYRNSAANSNLNWDQWYKRMGRSIYDFWQNADVIPGLASVHVKVTRNHDLSCEVGEFVPAPDIVRDVVKETAFRQAALKAVQMVSKYEIPDFPAGSDLQEVSFSVDMRRTVDGSNGFTVASSAKPSTP